MTDYKLLAEQFQHQNEIDTEALNRYKACIYERDAALDAVEAALYDMRALADDLAAKVTELIAAWDAEDVQEKNDLQDDFWRAMEGLQQAKARYREARRR